MRKIFCVACLAATASFPTFAFCDTPPDTGPAMVTVSPAFDAAVQNLSAGSYKQRQVAAKQLERVLATVEQQLIKDRSVGSTGPLSKLLAHNAGLTLWLQSALSRPPESDSDYLAWGFDPAHLPLVELAYSVNPADRLEAVHQLASMDDPHARSLLATLIGDVVRDVHLAAMDALWDVPPTPDMIEALWKRAGLESIEHAAAVTAPAPIEFHGHTIHFSSFDSSMAIQYQDGEIAADMLARAKDPAITARLEALLRNAAEDAIPAAQAYQTIIAWSKVDQLLATHYNKSITALLYKIALLDEGKALNVMIAGPQMMGGPSTWNRRVTAIAGVVTTTGQDAADYRLTRNPRMYSNMYFVQSAADESMALDKLKAWWSTHGSEYPDPVAKN